MPREIFKFKQRRNLLYMQLKDESEEIYWLFFFKYQFSPILLLLFLGLQLCEYQVFGTVLELLDVMFCPHLPTSLCVFLWVIFINPTCNSMISSSALLELFFLFDKSQLFLVFPFNYFSFTSLLKFPMVLNFMCQLDWPPGTQAFG